MTRREGRRSSRARVGQVLTAVVGHSDPEGAPAQVHRDPGALALDGLVPAAEFHRVAPALYVALRHEAELPAKVRRLLMADHHAQVFWHASILTQLAALADVLDGVGCRWAVVKGPALAEHVHPRPDLRTYLDLDVLVERRAVPAVVAALQAAGATFLDRNWTLIREGERAQTSLLLPRGAPLDLHWHLLNRGPIRHAFRLDMDAVLERAVRVPLGARTVPVLDDVDALIHLCLHAIIAGADRLVWLSDVHALWMRRPVDADVLVARARASGSALAVAVLLQRCRATLGTPVADALLERLAPHSPWRRMTALLEASRPVGENHGQTGTGRTILRATRASDLASLSELRRTSVRNVWARVTRDPTSRAGGRPEAEEPNLLQQVGGTDRDRDAFFAWVASTAEL